MARVVLVEPYYGGSHRAWVDAWVRHTRHEITLVTHPDAFWRWRMRGGAVTLAAAFDDVVAAQGRPDAVVVSGLVDVAAFAGHARRSLGSRPLATYFHESQMLYPLAPNQRARGIRPGVVQLDVPSGCVARGHASVAEVTTHAVTYRSG